MVFRADLPGFHEVVDDGKHLAERSVTLQEVKQLCPLSQVDQGTKKEDRTLDDRTESRLLRLQACSITRNDA